MSFRNQTQLQQHLRCGGVIWPLIVMLMGLLLPKLAEAQSDPQVWGGPPVYGPPVMSPMAPRGMPFAVEPASYAGTQSKSKYKKPLHPLIAKMPQAEEELEVIHHRSQLIVTRARITRWAVSDPSIIDVLQYSPNEISVIGLALGTAHLTLWFENEPSTDPVIYRAEVVKDPNLEEQRKQDYGKLERQLQVLFPNSQVYLVPLTTRVIVKGQARDQEEAAQIMNIVRAEWMSRNGNWNNGANSGYGDPGGGYGGGAGGGWGGNDWGGGWGNGWNNGWGNNFIINMLEVPTEQLIMIHVRIAELSRAQMRKFGIDLNYLINGGRHVLSASVGAGVGSTLSGIFENGEISVLIDWLASNRTAKVLAEPTLTVLSGHSASFISGGEFAVPTIVGVGGAQGTSTTFRGFGTSLIVTPTLIDKDLIRLRIVPEFSSLNSGNNSGGVPGLDTRRATTTVQLREGQTIALAGLFGHTSSAEVTRIPFLGELPYIGPRLFNAKQADQGENELLFLVTPEIVRPMEQDEVPPVPGFYVTHPNDTELYKYAMTEGAPDEGVYQLAPYGWGPGMGTEIGYRPYNPAIGPTLTPGPPGGLMGGSMQPGFGGGYGGLPTMAPAGGYSMPMQSPLPGHAMPSQVPTGPAPGMTPTPIPDPSVRFAPSNSQNPLLSRMSADEIAAQQKPSWNPFRRATTNSNSIQQAGHNVPPPRGQVQPADHQIPQGRYR